MWFREISCLMDHEHTAQLVDGRWMRRPGTRPWKAIVILRCRHLTLFFELGCLLSQQFGFVRNGLGVCVNYLGLSPGNSQMQLKITGSFDSLANRLRAAHTPSMHRVFDLSSLDM